MTLAALSDAVAQLGWTAEALRQVEQLRGWTPEAIHRLGLGYDARTKEVIFEVRDEVGEFVTRLRYQPDPALRGKRPKLAAERGASRHLFPPPELIRDDEVGPWLFLNEGEPDNVRLWSVGVAAVAVPGTGKWLDGWAARFGGRRWRVAICFDCDEAGRRAARRVALALVSMGVTARIVDLAPNRSDGYDLTDFLAGAVSTDDRQQAATLLSQFAEAAPEFVADPPPAMSGSAAPGSGAVESRYLVRRALADVEPRLVRWLLPGLIPLRALTLVAGVGGLGKSTWLAGVAAQVSRGDLLDGEPGDVLIVSFEDPAAEVLRPRVEAAQGDLQRVHEVSVAGDDGIDPVCLPGDGVELLRIITDVAARLVIIDPVVASFDVQFDSYKDQHVRAVLATLATIAERSDCAMALVGHLNKSPSRDAYIRIANSVAFWNAARSVVLITEDGPDEPELRLIAQSKANWARHRPIERHRLTTIILPESVDLETGRPIETARMEFVELATDVERGELLGVRSQEGKTEQAILFLEEALTDGDWHERGELTTLAGTQRIAERTLKRAAFELDIEYERRGFPSTTWWRLPQSGQGISSNDGPTANAQQTLMDMAMDKPSASSRASESKEERPGPD